MLPSFPALPMTIEEPETWDGVDTEALFRLDEEASARAIAGTLDAPTFRRIWAEARKACGPCPELLETLRMFARPGWVT